jgi:hypothetical protein
MGRNKVQSVSLVSALLLFQILDFQLVKNAGQCAIRAPVSHLFFLTLRRGSFLPGWWTTTIQLPSLGNTVRSPAFTFPFGSGVCGPNLPVFLRLPNSVACEALACPGWYIYVSLPTLPCYPSVTVILRL